MSVLHGEVYDVAADIRRGSPTFGKWVGVVLSSENAHQLYIPAGFAHGYCALSEWAVFHYKCSDYYAPQEERGLRWDDPTLAIDWPGDNFTLSDKDRELPLLKETGAKNLPEYKEPDGA